MTFLGFDKKDWLHKKLLVDEDKEKIQCLTNALFVDPNDGRVWQELGNRHADFDQEKALYCWSNALKSYLGRLEKFKDDAKKYSKDSTHLLFMDVYSSNVISEIASMYFALGSVYTNLEKYSLAVDAYKTSCTLEFDSDCLYYSASALYELKEYEKAEQLISENIGVTDDYKSHYLLGSIFWMQNEMDSSQKSYWNCIYKADTDAESCHYKSMAYGMLGNYQKKEYYLKKGFQIEPNNPQRALSLIEYYEENGDYNMTQKYYKKLHMLHKEQTREQKKDVIKNE